MSSNDATLHVTVRADAGLSVGYGHVRRTLAVIDALRSMRDVHACYLMLPEADATLVEQAGCSVRRLADERIETLVPAPLDDRLYRKLEKKAIDTWNGFGCTDYARFDFRLRDDKFYLLDINPNNDISFDTSFALAAGMNNYSYGQMVKRIVMMAAERHPLFGAAS